MANNEHINKVVKSTGETLIDLTNDTVTAGTLLKDVTAHDRSGAQIKGTAVIPTVNDGTLTIQQNGTTKATFTANQAGNATVDIQTGDAYGIDMYDDTLPIDITARGDNLEDWVIYGNNIGLGQKTKNKANTEGYGSKTNVVEITDIDTETGSIKATVSTSGSYASINYDAGLALENGKTYVFSCVVNVANSAAGLRIRNHNPAYIQNSLMFSSTGYKEATFTISDDKYPTGAFMSVMITDNTTTTGSIDISNLMVREANTESGFTPYGYELPIITKQTGKADITTNIYLGTSPLTEGQSLSKAQATTKDIPTYNGECVIDTSYPNKPRMEIIPTDSAINIIEKLRRIGASNGSSSTVRTIYAPDDSNGIQTTVRNNRTEVQVACGQASNANSKVVFTDSEIYGGIGNPTSASVNHFMFNDDCVGDSIGKLSSGVPLTGSEFNLNYETINLKGSTINIDDNMSMVFETEDDFTVNTINSPYMVINIDGISLLPKAPSYFSLLISRLPSGAGSELVVDSNGTVYQSSSSRDIKHDIQYIDNTDTYHNALMRIKPATYVYNNDKTETAKLGMIAEDIADVMPIAALTGEGGKVENYDTRAIISMLVMEVQRLNADIRRLKGDSNAQGGCIWKN